MKDKAFSLALSQLCWHLPTVVKTAVVITRDKSKGTQGTDVCYNNNKVPLKNNNFELRATFKPSGTVHEIHNVGE